MSKSGYKKTFFGWIPEEWRLGKLNSLGEFSSGFTIDQSRRSENSSYPYLRVANVYQGKLILDEVSYLTATEKELIKKKISAEDILIVEGHANIRELGRCALATLDVVGFTHQNHLHRFISDKIKVFPNFIVLMFGSKMIRTQIELEGATSSGLHTLSQSKVGGILIPIPPLPEQIKIAQILSTWDKAITQTQKLIEAKQRLKQGLMQQLLTGRMRFKEYIQSPDIKSTRFYSYPSDWAHPKIQEFAKEVSERNVDGDALTVLSCSKYSGFVNSLEYFGKQVFSDDTSNYKVIYRHQFGFPANHIEEGSIGLLKHVDKGMVSPIYIIFDVDTTKVNPDYLYLILKSETYKHIFRSRTSASVDRRGSLRWDEFSDIRVPMPSLSEQARIVGLFESCTEVIAGFESKKEVLIKQKQGLMQKLLTGQIRVKVEA